MIRVEEESKGREVLIYYFDSYYTLDLFSSSFDLWSFVKAFGLFLLFLVCLLILNGIVAGEVFQLQQELHQQEKNRDSLTKELTKMIQSNEELNRRLSALEQLQLQFNELQTNYNAILQVSVFVITVCLTNWNSNLGSTN